ncbi:MAG TPA: hypothetical protein VMU00_08855, partial [Steroidobacteraceae bacterium]|nr:hypothetical protein [Steroidobacteraceae bacterium]
MTMTMNRARPALSIAAAALVLAACGGGGSSSGGGGSSGGGPQNPTWTMGNYPAASTFAAYCAVPRTGTDPYNNNQPYPDRLGSVVWENFWIRSWVNAYYLWYSDVPDFNPASYSTTDSYFQANKTPKLTASGTPVDKFHFTYPTSQWEALSQGGVSIGYGVSWSLIKATPPNRVLLVAYTEPPGSGYPATSAGVNLARGASIIAVDGTDLVNSNDQASIDKLNAGLFPSAAGETHTFTVIDAPGAASRVVTMQSVSVTETPVQSVGTIATGTGTVGYMLFNDHIATAESGLIDAVNLLKTAGITDLVLDI